MAHLPLVASVNPEIVHVEEEDKLTRAAAILQAAKKSRGRHLLFIHADADARTDKKAREERINPGREAIAEYRKYAKDGADLPLPVPIVPIQEMEAWVLADRETLADELGIDESDVKNILQGKPTRFADPKSKLNEVIDLSPEPIEKYSLLQAMGQRIRLKELERFPSYRKFQKDLRSALSELFYG